MAPARPAAELWELNKMIVAMDLSHLFRTSADHILTHLNGTSADHILPHLIGAPADLDPAGLSSFNW